MPSRYTRDEIIKIAIDQARLPNWEVHDMPDGVVLPHAFSIQWLQDIIDFWHHHVPFSATIFNTPLTVEAHTWQLVLPNDFIIDVRNGYWTESIPGDTRSMRKRFRLPLQRFLNRRLSHQKTTNVTTPLWYCIASDDGDVTSQRQVMFVTPTPTQFVNGSLWYYQLPPRIEAGHKPKLPSDYAAIEYVKLRGLENYHIIPPGTSKKFTDILIASAKANGLLNEPEDDEIPFDEQVYIQSGGLHGSTYAWMGAR